mmetsp:Transcript_1125/g.3151  ORF Transcript_1125/g.3151 Transcript_1125/m.3151 type:complete len:237 (-) Transcript_1125:6-716(-)
MLGNGTVFPRTAASKYVSRRRMSVSGDRVERTVKLKGLLKAEPLMVPSADGAPAAVPVKVTSMESTAKEPAAAAGSLSRNCRSKPGLRPPAYSTRASSRVGLSMMPGPKKPGNLTCHVPSRSSDRAGLGVGLDFSSSRTSSATAICCRGVSERGTPRLSKASLGETTGTEEARTAVRAAPTRVGCAVRSAVAPATAVAATITRVVVMMRGIGAGTVRWLEAEAPPDPSGRDTSAYV